MWPACVSPSTEKLSLITAGGGVAAKGAAARAVGWAVAAPTVAEAATVQAEAATVQVEGEGAKDMLEVHAAPVPVGLAPARNNVIGPET